MLLHFFQKQEYISEVPDLKTLLCEIVAQDGGQAYYFHTPLNQAANDALARVVVTRLARDLELASHSVVADLGFAFHTRERRRLALDELQTLCRPAAFHADLDAGLADSMIMRERFRRVALTGLMLLRNPLGKRRKVGGIQWAEQQLFDRVRAAEPEFVLLRQALREVRRECCDAVTAYKFVQELQHYHWQCRTLPDVSPFTESWSELVAGPSEDVDTPDEALQRLHEALTSARAL
jgi:Lhr-like helicase